MKQFEYTPAARTGQRTNVTRFEILLKLCMFSDDSTDL